MATPVATTSTNGSLASIGTATKAFALAHPITLAVTGGVLLGAGTYYAVGRLFKKKKTKAESAAPAAA